MDAALALAPGVRANRPSATDPKSDARCLAALGNTPSCVLPEEAAGASASRAPVSQAPVVLFAMRRHRMFDRSPVWKWLRGSGKRRATVRKPPRPRLALEALDDRILPSVTATFSTATGLLTVAGDDLANTIVVSRNAAGT